MFLLDCLKYFAALHFLKCLKWLFRGVTAMIRNPATIRKVAVCLSCQTFEDISSQYFIKTICDKLIGRETHTKQELKLVNAMLESLVATLSVGPLDGFFTTPNSVHYRSTMADEMYQITGRHQGLHHPEFFQQLIQKGEACSLWLFNLAGVLAIKPVALSYEAADLLLQKLLSQFN